MGKMKSKAVPARPSTLTLSLAAPGMGPLHRAGLGGLAATLVAWEGAHRLNTKVKLPGDRRPDGTVPWTITTTSVTLDFGSADRATGYLQKLFAFAFSINPKGLVYLPGQHTGPSSDPVLAELQNALTLTFLQHGQTRKFAGEAVPFTQDVGENQPIEYSYRPLASFKHQGGWEDLVSGDTLGERAAEVAGPLNPGAVVRHVAFNTDTRIEETPERMLPLYFAIVGCVAFSAGRDGVLLVPEVTDLESFATDRPAMTPQMPQECEIAGASDAALQMQLRVLSARKTAGMVPAIQTTLFRTTSWSSKQKSRAMTFTVPAGDDRRLRRFKDALDHLNVRIAQKTEKTTVGRGKEKKTTETIKHFWANSLVRPLAADNLARERPWYTGFFKLMSGPDRGKIDFEKKGLIDMTNEDDLYDHPGEQAIIHSVHAALGSRYKKINDENGGRPEAANNRKNKEYERWRMAFNGAKTADQFRGFFADLMSRSGRRNKPIQDGWSLILPFLRDCRWQQARDLVLLGLVTYRPQLKPAPAAADQESK